LNQYITYILIPGKAELIDHSFAFYGIAFFGIILARYFLLAGVTYWFLYSAFGSSDASSYLKSSQIKTDLPKKPWLLWLSIKQDIKLSIISSIVFAFCAASVLTAYQSGITSLYMDIHQYPLWYLGISYIVVIILQDTYFYFLHRLLHHPRLFRWWHGGHHRSGQPTPWTSFALDLPESIAHALFLVGLIFLMPLHFVTVIAVLSTMTAWTVVNHLDTDRLPSNFPHQWCGHWFTGPAHHAIHHRQYALHYGLYFTFWDRWLGTQSVYYDQEFISLSIGREDTEQS
jgi:Delta7-sterol 5-desaturase